MPRILVLNANTTASVTDLVLRHVRDVLGADVELIPATARLGARYISTETSYAIAGHSALDCLALQCAESPDGFDAVLLACFGDPGLFALRELSPVPVVGLAEAAMQEAAQVGRYSIVTGGMLWKPMLSRLAHALGLSDAIASIRPITLTGDQIAADPEGALKFLAAEAQAAADHDGAQAVILGGAALAGLAARIAPSVSVPVIDSVHAGARAALKLAMQPRQPWPTGAVRAPAPSIGINVELARLLP
jgi:Asp/Glu/hydantoin racemase